MRKMMLIGLMAASSANAQMLVPVNRTTTLAPRPPAAMPMSATILGSQTSGVLRAGTEVMLRMSEGLTTQHKDLKEGQRVRLEVAENVMMGSRIVIPEGSPAMGELTDVRNKGMWGKSGHINGRVLYARVGDRQIRLSGTFNEHGTTGTAGVVAALALIPIAGFVMTGTSARMPVGTPVKAFLDEDLMLAN